MLQSKWHIIGRHRRSAIFKNVVWVYGFLTVSELTHLLSQGSSSTKPKHKLFSKVI